MKKNAFVQVHSQFQLLFVLLLGKRDSKFCNNGFLSPTHLTILDSAKPSKLTAKIIIVGIWLLAAILAIPSVIAYAVVIIPKNYYGGKFNRSISEVYTAKQLSYVIQCYG